MRLFTAIDLPADMLVRMEKLISALRQEANIHWSPLENLHITTKFIGDSVEQRIENLDAALKPLQSLAPICVQLEGLGWFPYEGSPKVLFARIKADGGLLELAAETNAVLAAIGIGKEPKPFSPHITLARIKPEDPLNRMRVKVIELNDTAIGHFQAFDFHLYSSNPGSNASIYRKLRSYAFSPRQ